MKVDTYGDDVGYCLARPSSSSSFFSSPSNPQTERKEETLKRHWRLDFSIQQQQQFRVL